MTDNNLRDWTVMVYFSADNDLQDEAFNNLSQMVEVGGTAKVHVLAQIDSRADIPTRRYFMQGPNDAVATDVNGKTNPGDIDDLLNFVRWASAGEHKAHNYLIVLWGHGNGIFDDEDDVGMARKKARDKAQKKRESKSEESAEEKKGPSYRERLAELGVIDNSFTSFELKDAFNEIEEILGHKVAILGMDACLMSMAEIAKQVSGSVELMVASEEAIPNKSWPYDRILRKLVEATNEKPVTKESLARLMIDEYIDHYQGADDPVTLSACRLDKIDDLAEALDGLGVALTELLGDGDLKKVVSRARRDTQMFLFREYVDLYDFCERLIETFKAKGMPKEGDKSRLAEHAIRNAERTMYVIGSNGGKESDFVLSCKSTSGTGGLLDRAHGVSIYFPPLPSTYGDLDLSQHTHWNNFVHGYMNAVFQPRDVQPLPERKGQTYEASSESSSEALSDSAKNFEGGRKVAPAIPDKPSTNGKKARLLLPRGSKIEDRLSLFEETLDAQAFLMMDEPTQIKVPEGTELDMPKRGNVKASSGTSVKASSGTSTKASSGTSTKAIRTENGVGVVGWLDVPNCVLNKSFSGGETRNLKNGTRIHPPAPEKGQSLEDVEPIIVINDVKFVVDESEAEPKKLAHGMS
jgi:Clostripain family